jgi:hypothetical protein
VDLRGLSRSGRVCCNSWDNTGDFKIFVMIERYFLSSCRECAARTWQDPRSWLLQETGAFFSSGVGEIGSGCSLEVVNAEVKPQRTVFGASSARSCQNLT